MLYMVSTPSPFTKEALKVLQLIFKGYESLIIISYGYRPGKECLTLMGL